MKIKFLNGKCAVCSSDVKVIETNEIAVSDVSLKGYKQYKDLSVQTCPDCGYAYGDIFKNTSNEVKQLVKTETYQNVFNNNYIKDIKIVGENAFDEYSSNYYECYSFVAHENKDYNLEFICIFKTIELKQAIIKNYRIQMFEDMEDLTKDEIEQYKTLENIVSNSLKNNLIYANELYELTDKTLFVRLMHIELLCKQECFQLAKQELEKLEKTGISQDLGDYFKAMIV